MLLQFIANLLPELILIFGDPGWKRLIFDNGPMTVLNLRHIEKNTVPPVIAGIDRKNIIILLFVFSKIELPQPPSGFN